jgi:serine/threonine-protein kinase
MASVYRAYEPKLDRYVALKVLPREFLHDPSFARRFRQEAQALAQLEHPNIVPIYAYDIDEAEGIPWMAMRLVTGGSLADLLKRERLTPARSVAILRGVADALDYAHAHAKRIVHRDVKPPNVLLDQGGRAYLADFGIAKILESSGGLTATGMITGTPQYMAPEQATGTKIGPGADVYSLGIVAYEMLTGRVPFSADTPVATMMKHVQDPLPLPPPHTVAEPHLRALLKCTAKKPEERWPTAGAFVRALEAGLAPPAQPALGDAPTIAEPPPVAPTVVRPRPAAALPPTPPPAPPPTRLAAPAPTPPPLPVGPTLPAARPPLGPPPLVAPPPPARRGGLGALPTVGFAVAGLLVLAGAVGVAVLLLKGGGRPEPSPSPTRPAETTTLPEPPYVPGSIASPPAPTPSTVVPPRRDRALPTPAGPGVEPTATPASIPTAEPTPTPRPAPTPAPPAPTPTPARPTEPPPPAVDPEVRRLAAALGDPDAAARRRAAQDLAALGPEAAPAAGALSAALADRNADVRLRAAEALGRIGPAARSSVAALTQALGDADPMVRAEAAKSLGLMAEVASPAAGPLGAALASPEVAVRREAAKALARIGRGAEPALRPLLAALRDKDKTVRAQAARALGRLGPVAREAIPALTAMSRDSDVIVSREAQAALESIGP